MVEPNSRRSSVDSEVLKFLHKLSIQKVWVGSSFSMENDHDRFGESVIHISRMVTRLITG
jgi:hypothetical protein